MGEKPSRPCSRLGRNTSSPSRSRFNQLLLSTWASGRPHSTRSEDVLPLTVPNVTRSISVGPLGVIQSDHEQLDVDYSRQSLGRPSLPNQNSTYSSQIGEQCISGITSSLGSDYLATNSMTDTALRWSDLMENFLDEGTEHHKHSRMMLIVVN